jgi:hypothetical protein
MGKRAGIHGGIVHGKAIRADGNYVVPGIWIPANQMYIPVSGVATATLTPISGTALPSIGQQVYTFVSEATSAVGFQFIVPEGIPKMAKSEAKIYWYTSGTAAQATVFGLYYNGYMPYISGTPITGLNYILSGVTGATVADRRTSATLSSLMISGALATSIANIGKGTIKSGQYVKARLIRETVGASPNIVAPINIIGVKINFIDY